MSKPRYPWWGYIKAVIRAYPALHAELLDARTQSITPGYGGMATGGGDGRTVEALALRTLDRERQLEHDAVEAAIRATKAKATAAERLRLMDMLFWKQTHTLHGAALALHISYRTARRWNSDFVGAVAENMGIHFPGEKYEKKTDCHASV